jgi:hypothetical protein
MSAGAAEPVEVNGKIPLGTRRLVVSHVENAASFFAYQEADAAFMNEIKETCAAQCKDQPVLDEKPKEGQASQDFLQHIS